MMYSVRQVLLIHLLMGIGFGVVGAAHATYKGRPRRFLTFGGEVFSWGSAHAWLRWYVLAFLFEFLTSFVPGQAAVMYLEVSLSFVEAAMVVLGAFVVDRACLLVEGDPTTVQPRRSLRERLAERRAARVAIERQARDQRRRDFEAVRRGH